ncbi:MAG: hypothetical protein UW94_C0014G0028 [Parcubacteria group bacterium GW2011_GWA2_45_14]|nr:MAG: hypothetical protein UW94_C0014G0028 [Parcubacteria group bacterium GW2011_GWA2_45_14]
MGNTIVRRYMKIFEEPSVSPHKRCSLDVFNLLRRGRPEAVVVHKDYKFIL